MKIHPCIPVALACLLLGCKKETQEAAESTPKPSTIVEASVLESHPAGLDSFPVDQLNAVINDWTEVDHSQFYYESTETDIKFPYQDGRFLTSDSREGSWRYYHCAGLRIRWGEEPFRYFLPSDVAKSVASAPKLNQEAEQDVHGNTH